MDSQQVNCSYLGAVADPIPLLPPDVKNMVLSAGVFAVITSIGGTLSNLLILLAVGSTDQTKSTATKFVLNLSVAEFLFSLLVLPVVAAQYFYIYRYNCTLLTDDHCVIFTTLRYTITQAQVQSILGIAFTRAIAVGIPVLYRYIKRSSVMKAYIAFIWIYSLSIRMPVALGHIFQKRFGSYDFNNKTLECDVSTDSPTTRKVYLGLDFYFPVVFIFLCYIFILIKVRQSSSRVRRASLSANLSNQSVQYAALNERDMRVLRSVLIIFLILLMCSIPVGITHRGDIASKYPLTFLIFHIIYWIQYTIDPIVYSIMNVNYRNAFVDFFKNILLCSISSMRNSISLG